MCNRATASLWTAPLVLLLWRQHSAAPTIPASSPQHAGSRDGKSSNSPSTARSKDADNAIPSLLHARVLREFPHDKGGSLLHCASSQIANTRLRVCSVHAGSERVRWEAVRIDGAVRAINTATRRSTLWHCTQTRELLQLALRAFACFWLQLFLVTQRACLCIASAASKICSALRSVASRR